MTDFSEKYEPVEPNYYNYEAINQLSGDIDEYLNDTTHQPISKINICAFTVNNDSKYPFLRYLLVKNLFDESLKLPTIPVFKDIDTKGIITYSEIYLFNLLLMPDNEKFLDNLEYKGCHVYENQVYIFYDLTKCNLNVPDIYRENKLWLVLIDEIMNVNHVCNFSLDQSVCSFFNENIQFCFLENENREKYEIPIVAYVGKNEKMLNFTYIFGVSSKNKDAILGPYYYFTDFQNAVKHGAWTATGKPEIAHGVLQTDTENGRYIKSGIIRFAVFLERTKLVHNFQNDEIDMSETKLERLNDETLDVNYERLTMRISDHDGMWAEQFDSVYVNKLELDNGTFLRDAPIIAVKDVNQQSPLSYHYIDKRYLKNIYDENEYYVIM